MSICVVIVPFVRIKQNVDCELFGSQTSENNNSHHSSTPARKAAKNLVCKTELDSQKLNCVETFHPSITLADPQIATTLVE
jgi:hypothetical protein